VLRFLLACAGHGAVSVCGDQLFFHVHLCRYAFNTRYREMHTFCGPSTCTNLAVLAAFDAAGSNAGGFNYEFSHGCVHLLMQRPPISKKKPNTSHVVDGWMI
jgi:hypothetical protein